jgi:hypothetical protein
MAFSSSWNYTESYTAANIIERALKRLGVYDASESVNSTEQTDALVVLNLIVKEWSARGADVWLRNTGHLFLPSPGTVGSYTVGTSGTAKFTSLYYVTTLAAAASASATTITVTDDTNMANADVILIEQDDGTLKETTINGAPAANSVTLAAGLASAAAAGNIVYSWPTSRNISAKVAKLVNAARRITNTDNAATNAGYMEGVDSPLSIIGEDEYRLIPQKLQTGVPVSIHHRQKAVNPELFVWPTGGSGNVHSIVLEYNAHIQDLDGTTNNLEIPPEGVNALAWQLAAELAPEYGIPEIEQRRIWSIANNKVADFFDYQTEDASVMFGVEQR